ncbi:MAG: ribosome biogenesis protein [Thermoplasmata archaeon HGW-Thermoplasmata-1]|nr:MAG: ribosome biogenesis protein [Thermoplasmata archaeon HGW-Thermoplasmata-1]
MHSVIKYCPKCKEYTLQDNCPECKGKSVQPGPARFSPEDTYGDYRRKLKLLDRKKKDVA